MGFGRGASAACAIATADHATLEAAMEARGRAEDSQRQMLELENLLLQATSLGLGAVPIGAYNPDRLVAHPHLLLTTFRADGAAVPTGSAASSTG